jgi:NAD-dependent deacetylase
MDTSLVELAAQCAALIKSANRIVVLSGAGMSTNAGIPDFRGPQGLYTRAGIDHPERIFDISYFRRDPSLFYTFHKEFLSILETITPTFAHRFLAGLENTGKLHGVITQNIDSLHQKAGSQKVLEIHGGIWENFCLECRRPHTLEVTTSKTMTEGVAKCDACGGVIKPDVVFFGEPVKNLEACGALAQEADLFFVLGSSLFVTPAAMLPSLTGGKIVVVNRGEVSPTFLPPQRITLFADEDLDTFFKAVNANFGVVDGDGE